MTSSRQSPLAAGKLAAQNAELLHQHVLPHCENQPTDMGVQWRLRTIVDIMQKNLYVLTAEHRLPNRHQIRAAAFQTFRSIPVDEFLRRPASAAVWISSATTCCTPSTN